MKSSSITKLIGLVFGATVSAGASAAVITLDNATLWQNPQTRLVEVSYELTNDVPVYVTLGITVDDIPIPDPVTVRGDVTTVQFPKAIEPGGGTKKIYWDAKYDWPSNLTENAKATVTAWFTDDPPEPLLLLADPTYIVVDLAGGSATNWYPVRISAVPPDASAFSKTTELWLRRIPAGAFTMGSPTASQSPDGIAELGRNSTLEAQHQVTLTRDFYIGVFEVTQKQWEQVMGADPSSVKGDSRPVESVTYDSIRGATNDTPSVDWPDTGNYVNPDSFMGRLRARTPFLFDLPTQAQWEYACRAGTTGAWNNGTTITNVNTDANLDLLGRNNSSSHVVVGSYQANDWGLYDMHGNIVEWCLDWYGSLGTSAVVDPKGPSSGANRVIRGGAYGSVASSCRSAWWSSNYAPNSRSANRGFRACIQPVLDP